jgi:hypothetical protein
MMTVVPVSVILLYMTLVAGGPKQLLRSGEKGLRTMVDWAIRQVP